MEHNENKAKGYDVYEEKSDEKITFYFANSDFITRYEGPDHHLVRFCDRM